jgi:exopolysaccharide biosynthesis polyprenyl glycosylphosphotransferase
VSTDIDLQNENRPGLQPNRVPVWLMPLIISLVAAFDLILAGLSFLFAFWLREARPIFGNTTYGWSEQFLPYAGIFIFAVAVRFIMLVYQRIYRFYGAFSYTQEAAKLLKAISVGSLLIIAWAFLFRGGFSFREFSYSRTVFLADFLISLGSFSAFHLSLRAAQTFFRNRGINLIPTLVIGSDEEVRQTVRELTDRRRLGYRVIGVVRSDETGEPERGLANGGEIPVLGGVDDISRLITEFQIQEVIITDNSIPGERLFDAMMGLGRRQRVEFRFAPSLFNMLPQKTSVEQIGVLPMVRLFREPLGDAQRFIKRISDLILAVVVSFGTLPIWVAAAIAVKLDSEGPIFFKQERVGMDGRVFLCYKFRSMHADADDGLHRDAYRKNIEGNADAKSEAAQYFGKVENDPRITRAGHFLRRSSIDELPQLINVFRGDMSMVGPRPPIPYEVQDYNVWHRKRLDMKPGITGLWQVSGRNRLTFEEMVRVDLFYVENWSLVLDLKIVLLTIPAVVRGDGAR